MPFLLLCTWGVNKNGILYNTEMNLLRSLNILISFLIQYMYIYIYVWIYRLIDLRMNTFN